MDGGENGRSRKLLYLVYIQALFLALAYVIGVWQTLFAHDFAITAPEVLGHGIASSGFGVLTAAVGFIAALQGMKRVSTLNIGLFVVTVVAGATGFAFLGNSSDPGQIAMTNLSMMGIIALGMPITGFSMAEVSRRAYGDEEAGSPQVAVMTYLALGALALTVFAGAAVPTSSLYAVAVVAHVGFAAVTVALVLGVLVLSLLEGYTSGSGWEAQRMIYSLLCLSFVAISGADGVVYLTSGGMSYVLVMAELAVLVYAFLIVSSGAPQGLGLLTRRGRRTAQA